MLENGEVLVVPSNCGTMSGSSNSSTDSIHEAMGRLKIDGDYTENGGTIGESGSYPHSDSESDSGRLPNRPGEPNCMYYLRTGTCGFGSKCRFNHPLDIDQVLPRNGKYPERPGEPECTFYLKTGTCKYGSTCKYHHPCERSANPVVLNILGLPMRQDEKPCPFYMRTGACKFGVACKFDHPQPSAAAGNVLAIQEPRSYDSSVVPTSSMTNFGRMSALALPNFSYASSPSIQVPQTYVPVLVAPSPGWNTYMGSISPMSISSSSGELGSNREAPASLSQLPQRPDQPECRYFLKTGSCKYGTDCRYHHPGAETLSTPYSFSPLGLPLRPGQAVCSHYNLYGLCKYGPTCRFDHPFSGYSCNFIPSQPPIFTNRITAPTLNHI